VAPEERTLVLVKDARTIERLERATGKAVWTWRVPGTTTRSGEPPLVLGEAGRLLVVLPENIGYRLQRMDPETGKPIWTSPPLLPVNRLEPAGWMLFGGVLYHEGRGRLRARSADDGKELWDRPLPGKAESGPWGLCRSGGVVVWPLDVSEVRFQFRWLWASVQWRGGPLLDRTRSLTCFDPSGTVKQQWTFAPARGEVQAGLTRRGFAVVPVLEQLDRGPAPTSGLRIGSCESGLVVELGSRVWAIRSSSK
jgi:outer membrane protein assembly factor BamB